MKQNRNKKRGNVCLKVKASSGPQVNKNHAQRGLNVKITQFSLNELLFIFF